MENERESLFYGILVAPIPILICQQEFNYYQKGAVHIDCHQKI